MSQQVVYELSIKDLFTGKLNNANAAVNKFESSMSRAQSSAMSLGAALGVTFGIAGVVAFGRSMLDAGMKVENASTGLTTLLKDGAEAQKVIADTMKDAMETPFSFESLLQANKAIISAGVESDKARVDVLNLANAIAATGGGNDELNRMVVNLQQIKNAGKATAMDIRQFAYAGVNIYKVLSDATGQPIAKIREMGVSYDMLTMALKKAHDEGGIYYNGLENMQKNTSVQISNLGDGIFQLSVKIFNDLKPSIDSAISSLQGFIKSLSEGWDWVMRNGDAIKGLATGAAVAFGLYKGYLLTTKAIQTAQTIITYGQIAAMYVLGTAYDTSSIATRIFAAAQYALNAVMSANPIGLIVIAIGALVAGIVYAYNHFEKFRGIVWATWAVLKEFGSTVASIFIGVGKAIVGAITFNPSMVMEGAEQTIQAVRGAGERIGRAAQEGYEAGIADFQKGKATVKAPVNVSPKVGKGTGANAPTLPSETKGAKGQKAVTINIKIEDLVKELNINTVNMKEGAGKLREIIAETLMAATNDAQLISGQ